MNDEYFISEKSSRRKQEDFPSRFHHFNQKKQHIVTTRASCWDKKKATTTDDTKKNAIDSMDHIPPFLFWFGRLFPFRLFCSMFAFFHGFFYNVIVDVCTAFSEGRKQVVWKEASERIILFLRKSGLKDEFNEGISEHFLPNIRMINVLQRYSYPNGRQDACSFDTTATETIAANNQSDCQPDFQMVSRIMNYATAAYGQQMIASALFEHGGRIPPPPHGKNIDHVCKHIGLSSAKDIIVWEMDLGEDMDCLRHFCAVDHINKKVVLAIRGTFSVTSTLVDLVGYCDDFCGGKAHSGMAKMARAIWKRSGKTITNKLNDFDSSGNELERNGSDTEKRYELIITGHSLGAGVASLLNILLHHDEKVKQNAKNHSIRCVLFACPPTFYPLNAVPQALKHTIAIVNGNDVVPYLSIDAARRLLRLMVTIEKLKLPLWKKVCIGHELLRPSEDLLECCRSVDNSELSYIRGAPMVFIPAGSIGYMYKKKKQNAIQRWFQMPMTNTQNEVEYKVSLCDPLKLAAFAPTFGPGSFMDHFVGKYEYALNSIATANKKDSTL